jgi:hypothetical protein
MKTSRARLVGTSSVALLAGASLLWLGSSLPVPLGVAVTILVTLGYATFVQAVLHLMLGHHRMGGSVFRVHVTQHHALYGGKSVCSARYRDEERSLTPLFIVPCALSGILGYFTLSFPMFVTFVAVFGASFWLQAYLHVQFHLERPWLLRFIWFRELRDLHTVHHHHQGRNFGLVTLCWDRLLGTYSRPSTTTTERGPGR